jgi:sugar lactone lactonase YvrE
MTTLSLIAGGLGGAGNADDTGGAARCNRPTGAVADGAGNLYLSDTGNHTLRKVVAATGVVTTLAGSAGIAGFSDGIGSAARFHSPSGLALDGAGNLYLSDTGNDTIRKVVLATGAVTTLAGTAGTYGSADGTGAAARFSGPEQIALDAAGNLYVADSSNSTIRKVVISTGEVTTLAGTAGLSVSTDGTGAAAHFIRPWGVAVDGAGNLYVADGSTIRKVVLATGGVTTLAGVANQGSNIDGIGAAARFNVPANVAVDANGNLNGDYEPTYFTWLITTCRSCPHEHAIRSAGRPVATAHSAA